MPQKTESRAGAHLKSGSGMSQYLLTIHMEAMTHLVIRLNQKCGFSIIASFNRLIGLDSLKRIRTRFGAHCTNIEVASPTVALWSFAESWQY
jgi:ribulose 1,5-bisphosphate carboxylase large subunit-like protein